MGSINFRKKQSLRFFQLDLFLSFEISKKKDPALFSLYLISSKSDYLLLWLSLFLPTEFLMPICSSSSSNLSM